jgi:adenosyl cobinamide kinase/adenosyl cobinamide phosphate guanylyltransferase
MYVAMTAENGMMTSKRIDRHQNDRDERWIIEKKST